MKKEENDREAKKQKSGIKDVVRFFKKFFSGWLFLGFICLFSAYMLYDYIPTIQHDRYKYLMQLTQSVLNSVGIALIIASIFTYTIETDSFLKYVKSMLTKIVISKDFLNSLNTDNKKEALGSILKPSESQTKLYSNINEYFQEYINESMVLFNTNFKSDFNINLFASYDNEIKKIKLEEKITYRVYKACDNYEPIITGFEDEHSKIIEMQIIAPDGERQTTNEVPKTPKREESGFEWTEYKYDIDDKFNKYSHLTISQNLEEYGEDHWQYFCYKTLSPSDGICCSLRCDSDIVVRAYMIFDKDKHYSVKQSDDKKKIEIMSNQWLKPGVGFGIIIGKVDINNESL